MNDLLNFLHAPAYGSGCRVTGSYLIDRLADAMVRFGSIGSRQTDQMKTTKTIARTEI